MSPTIIHLCLQPWDDETDMDEILKSVKSVEMEGLTWGAHKLIPIGYGIKKLQVGSILRIQNWLFGHNSLKSSTSFDN